MTSPTAKSKERRQGVMRIGKKRMNGGRGEVKGMKIQREQWGLRGSKEIKG